MSLSEGYPSAACNQNFGRSGISLELAQKRLQSDWAKLWLPSLTRALCVACSLAGAFIYAARGERPEVAKPAASPTRPARASSPLITLAQGENFPLDADFSMEQAARSWARRLSANDHGDPPGTIRFGGQRVQSSIVERVVKAAKNTGSDPALLMSIADKEFEFFIQRQGEHLFRQRPVPVRGNHMAKSPAVFRLAVWT